MKENLKYRFAGDAADRLWWRMRPFFEIFNPQGTNKIIRVPKPNSWESVLQNAWLQSLMHFGEKEVAAMNKYCSRLQYFRMLHRSNRAILRPHQLGGDCEVMLELFSQSTFRVIIGGSDAYSAIIPLRESAFWDHVNGKLSPFQFDQTHVLPLEDALWQSRHIYFQVLARVGAIQGATIESSGNAIEPSVMTLLADVLKHMAWFIARDEYGNLDSEVYASCVIYSPEGERLANFFRGCQIDERVEPRHNRRMLVHELTSAAAHRSRPIQELSSAILQMMASRPERCPHDDQDLTHRVVPICTECGRVCIPDFLLPDHVES